MMIMLKSTHDDRMKLKDQRIAELEADIETLIGQRDAAEKLVQRRGVEIATLEDDNANLRTRNLELFNRNTDLSTQLAPFKMPRRRDHRGWFVSAKQVGAQA
jgi:chromosome segregation ATPase